MQLKFLSWTENCDWLFEKWSGLLYLNRGICVLTPTFNCNFDFAPIFFTLRFFPSLFTSHCDFTPSQRSKQGQIRKDQGLNHNDLWKIKGKITKLKKIRAKPQLHFKAGARTPKYPFKYDKLTVVINRATNFGFANSHIFSGYINWFADGYPFTDSVFFDF